MNDRFPDSLEPKRIDALSRQVGDELLVYDAGRHRGHCLNRTAAAVWLACDGKSAVNKIAADLKKTLKADVDEDVVLMTLDKLEKAGLLSRSPLLAKEGRILARRELMRKIGTVAAVALPVVTSILVPLPAHAASCFPLLHVCNSNAQCCSGHCGIVGLALVCV